MGGDDNKLNEDDYYDNDGIQKGIVLARYVSLISQWLKYEKGQKSSKIKTKYISGTTARRQINGKIFVQLKIHHDSGKNDKVSFEYDPKTENISSVVREMVETLELDKSKESEILSEMKSCLVAEIKSKFSHSELNGGGNGNKIVMSDGLVALKSITNKHSEMEIFRITLKLTLNELIDEFVKRDKKYNQSEGKNGLSRKLATILKKRVGKFGRTAYLSTKEAKKETFPTNGIVCFTAI